MDCMSGGSIVRISWLELGDADVATDSEKVLNPKKANRTKMDTEWDGIECDRNGENAIVVVHR